LCADLGAIRLTDRWHEHRPTARVRAFKLRSECDFAGNILMNANTIELDGFEIELASEGYCDRGGDHRELLECARADRTRLGHNIDESAVLCVRCMKAIALKA